MTNALKSDKRAKNAALDKTRAKDNNPIGRIPMTEIENQILETWRIHNRITFFMLENIPDAALKATLSTRGGRDIARQLAHIHMVRVSRLEPFSKRIKTPLIKFEKGESPNKKKLQEALAQSGTVIEKYIQYSQLKIQRQL